MDASLRPSPNPNPRQRIWWALVIYGAVALAAVAYGPAIARNDVYSNDAVQQVPFMYRWAEPGLFAGDIAVDYWAKYGAPPLRAAFYYVVGPFTGMQAAGEFLGALLGASAGLLIIRFCALALGWGPAGVAAGLIVTLGSIAALGGLSLYSTTVGGLARSFGWPLVLAGIVTLAERRWKALAAVVLIAAFSYPPVYVLLAAAVAIWTLAQARQAWTEWRQGLALVAGTGIAAGAGAALLYTGVDPRFGPLHDAASVLAMPEFRLDNFVPLADGKSLWSSMLVTRFDTPWPVPLIFLGTAFSAYKVPRVRPQALAVLSVGAASYVTYALAFAVMLRLYEPTRFTRYGILPAAVAGTAVMGAAVWEAIPARLREFLVAGTARLGKWPSPGRFVVAAVLIVITVGATAVTVSRYNRYVGGTRNRIPPAVSAAIAALPPDAIIASHPNDPEQIPLLFKRRVLVTKSYLYPYHRDYYAAMFQRLKASMEALYATSWAGAVAALRPTGATHILVNPERFRDNQWEWKQWQPAIFVTLFERGQREGFALASPPPAAIAAQENGWMLLRVQ